MADIYRSKAVEKYYKECASRKIDPIGWLKPSKPLVPTIRPSGLDIALKMLGEKFSDDQSCARLLDAYDTILKVQKS